MPKTFCVWERSLQHHHEFILTHTHPLQILIMEELELPTYQQFS